MIEGPTGTGKTVEITEGILDWADRVGPVLVCDPTRVEYRGVQDRPNVQIVASTVEDMIATIRHVYHEMTGRYQALASEEVNENDLAPLLLVIDDYRYFKTMVEQWWAAQTTPPGKPNKCPVLETVGSLARKGRSAKITLLLGAQRITAELMSAEMRDNFSCRPSKFTHLDTTPALHRRRDRDNVAESRPPVARYPRLQVVLADHEQPETAGTVTTWEVVRDARLVPAPRC